MDYGRIIFALFGFSSSFFLCLPNLKAWHKQQITTKKLKVISKALEEAEEKAVRYQERHDQILSQISSHYLTHQDLQEALAGARAAMNEALQFVVNLRDVQMKILINFPNEASISIQDRPRPRASRPRNN